MSCVLCSLRIKLISSCCNVTMTKHNDILNKRLSELCNLDIVKHIFNIYLCVNGHFTIECRNCRWHVSNIIDAITHYITCSTKYEKSVYQYPRVICLKRKYTHPFIFLLTSSAIKLISHLPALDIDYMSAFGDDRDMFRFYNNVTGIISSGTDDMLHAINIIKKQQTSCTICSMVYETFPSLEVVLRHFAQLHSS